jgi:hypothetical protein
MLLKMLLLTSTCFNPMLTKLSQNIFRTQEHEKKALLFTVYKTIMLCISKAVMEGRAYKQECGLKDAHIDAAMTYSIDTHYLPCHVLLRAKIIEYRDMGLLESVVIP